MSYAMDPCARLVDITRKRLGLKALKVEYLLVSGAARVESIGKGLADLECGSTTIPHYIAGARIMARADSALAALSNFERRRLVSTQGLTAYR